MRDWAHNHEGSVFLNPGGSPQECYVNAATTSGRPDMKHPNATGLQKLWLFTCTVPGWEPLRFVNFTTTKDAHSCEPNQL